MIGQNTIPLKIKNGVLIILAKHAVFATELSYMAEELLQKLYQEMPKLKSQVKKLKFITSPRAFSLIESNKNQVQTTKKTIHQYSPKVIAAKKEALELFADIDDPELLDTFVNLYIQKLL
jgi:hypothetical protein